MECSIRKVTAQEERRKKLHQYLATKGKLKPQDSQNTKSYLKDCTNHQNPRQPPVSKSAVIVKQKDKVPLKHASDAAPARKAKPANPAFKSVSNTTVSQRLLGKGVPSVLSRPSSTGKLPSRKCSQQPCILQPGADHWLKARVLSDTQVVRTIAKQQPIRNPRDGVLPGTLNLHNEELSTVVKSSQKKHFCGNENIPGKMVRASENKPKLEIGRTGKSKVVLNKPWTKSGSEHVKTLNLITKQNLNPKEGVRNVASKTRVLASLDKSQKISQNLSRPIGKTNGLISSRQLGQTYTISKSLPSENTVHLKSKTTVGKHCVQIQRPGPSLPCKTANIKAERPSGSKSLPLKQPFTHVSNKPVAQTALKTKVTAKRATSVPVKSQQSDCITKKNRLQEAARKSEARTSRTIPKLPTSTFRSQDCIITPSTTRNFATPKSVVSCLSISKAKGEIKVGPATTGKKTEQDRRKKLEEWLNSKGKTYKRPPMTLGPPKKPLKEKWNTSFWDGIEDDEEQQCLTDKIHHMLDECLKLIEEGYPSEQLSAVLSRIPEGEKFAKFWICKAKLQERDGPFDLFGLYELAVRAGAEPIQQLREVVFAIKENRSKKSKAVMFQPLLPCKDTSALPKTFVAGDNVSKELKLSSTERIQIVRTPGAIITKGWTDEQGSYLKFQVGEIPRLKGKPALQDLKLLTPVRRSVRIEHSVSHYPDILQEHDTVVASLNELLDMAETSSFVYRQNEALPKEIDTQILGL